MRHPTEPRDIAIAHHCTIESAKRIWSGEMLSDQAIIYFGPFRCWFKRGVGWMLDGKPISANTLRWRAKCDSGDVR